MGIYPDFVNREREIWVLLMADIKNPFGVAGLIGNLYAESSLNPYAVNNVPGGIDGVIYAEMVDSKEYGREEFSKDKAAFGLAQWRYWSRKQALYDCCVEAEKSIGDLWAQVWFLLKEIKTYKTVWKVLTTAKSVAEASDVVLLKYEKPKNVTDAAKAKRALYGQQCYDRCKCYPTDVRYTVTIPHLTYSVALRLTMHKPGSEIIAEGD